MSTVDLANGSRSNQPAEAKVSASGRITSVDMLRGLVMVVMVLDHVRDFVGDVTLNPTDLRTTTFALFFTRWVTHFCAPVFVFLAGTGAYFSGLRKSPGELSLLLLKRGLLLIFLEVTVIRFGLTFDPTFAFVPLTVIWVIGLSMIAMAGIIRLPFWSIIGFALLLIAGHNLFDGYTPKQPEGWVVGWRILHQRGLVVSIMGRTVFVLYPLIPWVGVMAAGYALGPIFQRQQKTRRLFLVTTGLALVGGFLALRASNLYGDPNPWTWQDRPGFTLLSFLNLEKYPPSLLYLMMTLGPALVFLGVADNGLGKPGQLLAELGREPLFYYVLQWYLIHLIAIVVGLATDQPIRWLVGNGPFNAPPGYGHDLPFLYATWLICVALLWLAVRAYSRWKLAKRKVIQPEV